MKKIVAYFSFYIFFSFLLFAEGRVSGKVFYNYTTTLDTSGDNGFNMKRAYLTFANDVNESVSYKVTYDMGKNDGGSAHTAFLKVAAVTWKTAFGDVSIGMQGMNMFKTMENTWGHRFIQKMPMDTYGFSPSADLGLGISRTIGSLSTSALFTNGTGFKKAEDDSHKKLSAHLVYGESKLNKNNGFNIGSSFSFEPYDGEEGLDDRTVMSFFSGYAVSGFRGGLELDIKEENIEHTSQIICAYGTYQFSDKISILGRIDNFHPNINSEKNKTLSMITGFHYNLDEGLTVAPTLTMITTENGDDAKSIVINFRFKF